MKFTLIHRSGRGTFFSLMVPNLGPGFSPEGFQLLVQTSK